MTWPIVSLGEICRFNYGKALKAELRTAGNTAVMGSNGAVGLHGQGFTSGPTVVIGRKGSIGAVAFVTESCWPIDTTYYVDSASTSQDLRWLYWSLQVLGLTGMNKAAAVPGLNRDDAYQVRLALPPLPEQRRIAEILDRADELRAKRRRALTLLDELADAIFVELAMSAEVSWVSKSLSELVVSGDRINYGVVQPGDSVTSGVPLIRAGDLKGGVVDRSSLKLIAAEIESAYGRSRLRGNEILVSCVGSIGEVALVRPQDVGSNIARAVARIPLRPEFDRDFVAATLRSPQVQQHFVSELRTVAQPTLNIKQLSETSIRLPPIDVQIEFAARVASVERARRVEQLHLASLDELFASLQYGAFSGEL
jgi:type I restriction enzyme S subunit